MSDQTAPTVSDFAALPPKRVRHMLTKHRKQSHSLIGEYVDVYGCLLFRIAALVELQQNPGKERVDAVQEMVNSKPHDFRKAFRHACRHPANDAGETVDVDAIIKMLRHFSDLRNALAHLQAERGMDWQPEVSPDPFWRCRIARSDKEWFVTNALIRDCIRQMRGMGKPLAMVARALGLEADESLDNTRPMTEKETKATSRVVGVVHGTFMCVADDIEPTFGMDGLVYEDLAAELQKLAKKFLDEGQTG